MPSFRIRFALVGAMLAMLAMLVIDGCLIKEKSGKAAVAGMVPPWDPAKFAPKRLEGPSYRDSVRTFAVFDSIARIDSLAGDPKGWKAEKGAIDTLRIETLFDTAF